MSLKLIAFSWKLLTASCHPSPNISLCFDRLELGDQGKLGNQDGGQSRWRLVVAPMFIFK